MKDASGSIEYAIAYLLPGFLALWVVAAFDPVSAIWLASPKASDVTIGAFLFTVMASFGVGIFINGLRWKILDQWVLKWRLWKVPDTPKLDRSKENDHSDAYRDLRARQYNFFQFYGNTFVVLLGVAIAVASGLLPGPAALRGWVTLLLAFLFVEWVLFSSAKSCLTKYRDQQVSMLGLAA